MRIVLIADVFPPLRSSGAVQLRDLSREFARQGHEIVVLVAAPEIDIPCKVDEQEGFFIVRLKSPKTKDVGYIRRTIGELLMPFMMLWNFRKSSFVDMRWDGVVWYSPSIFLGPIAKAIKTASACRSYLIVRDIFPEWAADMGVLRRGIAYRFFKAIASYQYSVADVIGIQSSGNRIYFTDWVKESGGRLEVLPNWLASAPENICSIVVPSTRLAGRRIFVYAGNMGVAQGVQVLLGLAEYLKDRTDIGFLFVGRGSDIRRLEKYAENCYLDNVVFFDEIDPDEIPALYAQCTFGLVALDSRHKTHNIPGKFLSYMQAGLPVLAAINPGNDLVELIEQERVGRVSTGTSIEFLAEQALRLVDDISSDGDMRERCRRLGERMFSPKAAVQQIVSALKS